MRKSAALKTLLMVVACSLAGSAALAASSHGSHGSHGGGHSHGGGSHAAATPTAAASTAANPTAPAAATLVATAAAASEARSLACSDLRPRCQIVDRDCSPPANTAIQDRHGTSEAARIAVTVRVQVPQPIPRHGPAPAQTGAIRIDPQADSDPIVHRAPGRHSALRPGQTTRFPEALPPPARNMPHRSAQIALQAPSEILPMDPRAKDGVPVGEPCRGEGSRPT